MTDNEAPQPETVAMDRRGKRVGERRKRDIPAALEGRKTERRAQGERRRQVDPTTCERDYNEEEITFMKAMDQYKRDNRRPFPAWSEVLEVLQSLGYRRVAEPRALPGLSPSAKAAGNDAPPQDAVQTDRRGKRGSDRRKRNIPVALDRRKNERRGRPETPPSQSADNCEQEITFMRAMDQYKRDNRRPFPTWSEVLEVLHALGYRKVAEPTVLPGQSSAPPKG